MEAARAIAAPATWATVLRDFDAGRFAPDAARRQAERFSRDACLAHLKAVISETVAEGADRRW